MKTSSPITTLFLDIGGVLLTDGWGPEYRALAAETFALDPEEMENRHRHAFDTYEIGKLTIEEYLNHVVFYEKRTFVSIQFQKFMFEQATPYPRMIELIRNLKAKYGLKVIVVSNEGRELNAERIRKFELDTFVDFFVSSCFVHLRKPDAEIFRFALDMAQVPVGQILYIENTSMFVRVAEGLGIQSILHTEWKSTRKQLAARGLTIAE